MRKDPNAPPSAPKQHEKVKKPKPTKKSRGRAFLMSNYRTRALVVKFLYVGERFAGFARQDHMEDTVERYVIDALERTKLIEGDIEQAGYSRCGRTDRGVSAFGQVVAVTVRSNLPVNAELVDHASLDAVRPGATFRIRLPSGDLKTISEVDYPTHINRALPPDIRVYSVVAAPTPTFSARFDCTARMYRYFFLKNDLDIDRMRAAAQLLVGKHDYRNFCRIDTNVNTFERRVMSFDIVACADQVAADPRQQMYRCEVRGRAFLWHQVRCMVQVLFLVASGKEEPALIAQLLDVAQTPRKPQYDMAPDAPLVLHDCFFDNVQFEYVARCTYTSWCLCQSGCILTLRFASYSPLALHQVHDQLTRMWEQHCIQGAILRSNLDTIGEFPVTFEHVTSELDHYAPTLGQLLTQQGHGGGADVVEASGDDDGKSTLPPATFAWKHVLPLLPIASRRRNIPLLTRDTGDSVDEKKSKIQARKRRRREVEEEEAAGADGVQTSALMDTKNSSTTNTSISEAAEEKHAAFQEGDVIVDGDVIADSSSSMSERGTAA